jgi:hypothetical protein
MIFAAASEQDMPLAKAASLSKRSILREMAWHEMQHSFRDELDQAN